ncbi:NOL7 protein, partial [Nyctibius bracteatus]|nr:NOL7 protein [Nyctibius bracteatus]
AAGKSGLPAALLSPPSSEDEAEEAPEEVTFGAAREAAETERKLVGEAARRHRELLKEKRRRHQELFTEQKVRRLPPPPVRSPRRAGGASAPLTPLSPAEAEAAARGRAAGAGRRRAARTVSGRKRRGHGAVKRRQGQAQRQVKKDKQRKGARSKGNYTAVCLKDQSLTVSLHEQLAKDFLNTHLYGPDASRAQGKSSGPWVGLHLD